MKEVAAFIAGLALTAGLVAFGVSMFVASFMEVTP